jgi:hypothetical protein
VYKCFKRFDASYMGEKSANAATTNHITGELDKLAVRNMYNGNEQVYTASGSGMHITHVGNSIICTP